jgi:hypothetical protein
MSNEQGDVAVLGKPAHSVEQGVSARVVETLGDVNPTRVELIIKPEQLDVCRARTALEQSTVSITMPCSRRWSPAS